MVQYGYQSEIKCELYPDVGVGPFKYGDKLEMLIKVFDLKLCEREHGVITWQTWEVCDQEIRLYFNKTNKEEREGLIRIGCFDHLFYQGIDIFGLNLVELRSILGKEDDVDGENYDCGRSVEYFDLGIQVWIDKQGKCNAVMCNEIIPEEK